MKETLIFLALFLLIGAIYYIAGSALDKSRAARNLDMTLDGLFKALGIATVCIGLMSVMPFGSPVSTGQAEALSYNEQETASAEELLDNEQSLSSEAEVISSSDSEVEATSSNDSEELEGDNTPNEDKSNENKSVEDIAETNESISPYQDGVYTGVGRGFKGDITMEVEVVSGEITRVEVVSHRDDRKWFNRANRVVPQSIVDEQSSDVDTVSGATYTSLGMIEGAEEALSKSRGE